MAAVQEEVWTLSYVLNALNQVCEAATVRQQQWCLLSAGASVDDVVHELHEADHTECQLHSERLAKAISVVERFIVATKLYVPIIDGPE